MKLTLRNSFVALTLGALVVAACGSDSKSSSTNAAAAPTTNAAPATGAASATNAPAATGGAADSGTAAAEAAIADFLTEPSGIAPTTALPSKAPKKKIAWMECDVPTCTNYLTPGFKDATAAIGWDLQIIPSKSADPTAAMQQALDGGADYIAITGSPAATYTSLAAAAKAKGVPILSCYATDEPTVDSNILTQCGDTSFVTKTGPLMADYAIADSKGDANVLFVTINDFPVLKAESDAFKAELTKNCATCSFTELNVSLDDLIGGKVPAAIASQLQANSKLNYLMYAFGDLPGGVTAALQGAGLDKQVTQIGQDFSDADLPEISAGTHKAWSADPKGYAAWLMVDAAARLATGTSPADLVKLERPFAPLPTWIVADAKSADAIHATGGDWNPPDMSTEFKKLWLIS